MERLPVAESKRLQSLDVLRGVALLGILVMNIGAFSMPSATYFNPTVYADFSGINAWLWGLMHVFFDLKFMAIFSMLFGAGIVLTSQRIEARGLSASGVHYRRMLWLILFGLLHAHLIWYGDILYAYGMCALVLYWFRKLSPTWLIMLGVSSMSLASLLMLAAGLSAPHWPEDQLAAMNADFAPSADAIAAEIAAYQGGWLAQMEYRMPAALEMQTATFLIWALWRVSGLMLIGMALFKLGVFSAERSNKFYSVLLALALGLGLPLVGYGIYYNEAIDWRSPEFFFLGMQFNYWGSVLVALGWVALVMMICRNGFSALTHRLAAVGRTAFSNYILQSLLCTFVFYGHGLGWFGQVERSGQLLVVLAIWLLQLWLAPLWLRYFQYGPLEWLWRTLTYLRRPAFRRQDATA